MNKDEERLRRAKRTGKYFDTNTKPKNLWLNHIFPIILLISLMLYIYMEVT